LRGGRACEGRHDRQVLRRGFLNLIPEINGTGDSPDRRMIMRPITSKGVVTLGALVVVAMAGVLTTGGPTPHASGVATSKTYPTLHKTITVDGLNIF
jgi:hypothetical protein